MSLVTFDIFRFVIEVGIISPTAENHAIASLENDFGFPLLMR